MTPADFKGAVIGVPATGVGRVSVQPGRAAGGRVEPGQGCQLAERRRRGRRRRWRCSGARSRAWAAGTRCRRRSRIAAWCSATSHMPFVSTLVGQILITREDYLQQHPDIAVAVARGIAEATVFALANPEATLKTHWRPLPGDEAAAGDGGGDAESGEGRAGFAHRRDGRAELAHPRPTASSTPAGFDATAEIAFTAGQFTDRGPVIEGGLYESVHPRDQQVRQGGRAPN